MIEKTSWWTSNGSRWRVFESVVWSGTRFVIGIPRNLRSDIESAQRHSSPRSDSMPSKYPIRCIRKYTPGATDLRPGVSGDS